MDKPLKNMTNEELLARYRQLIVASSSIENWFTDFSDRISLVYEEILSRMIGSVQI